MIVSAVQDDDSMQVIALVCGVAERDWEHYGLLMLEAYIDDSGRGQGPMFILQGYLASPAVWVSFSRDWRDELEAEPSVQYFKMKEAASRTGQFQGQKTELIEFRISRLVSIIERYALDGITVALPYDDLTEIVVPYFDGLCLPEETARILASPYFLCFYHLILVLMEAQRRRGVLEPIDFIFDEQGKEGRNIRDYWYLLRDTVRTDDVRGMMVNEPVFRDDKVMLPLQAADLTAWQLRRFISQIGSVGMSPILERLGAVPHVEYLINGGRCQAYVDNFERRSGGEWRRNEPQS